MDAKFIELEDLYVGKVSININAISRFREHHREMSDHNSIIIFIDGQNIEVMETYQQIKELINEQNG
jgi:hypothetical protein